MDSDANLFDVFFSMINTQSRRIEFAHAFAALQGQSPHFKYSQDYLSAKLVDCSIRLIIECPSDDSARFAQIDMATFMKMADAFLASGQH